MTVAINKQIRQKIDKCIN